jgi:acyl-CoA thioesterase
MSGESADPALAAIRRYMSQDRLAALLGMELLEIAPGRARVRLVLDERHLNGAGIVHGGTIFSLADVAFAAASNAHGTLALALSVHIAFVKAAHAGETLTASAAELSLGPKVGTYLIEVRNQAHELVASFHGTVYRKQTPVTELLQDVPTRKDHA